MKWLGNKALVKMPAGCFVVDMVCKRRMLLRRYDEQSDSHFQCTWCVHRVPQCEGSGWHDGCHSEV